MCLGGSKRPRRQEESDEEEDSIDLLQEPTLSEKLSGVTLADITSPKSKEAGFKEEEHMQPAVMKLLKAAAEAVGGTCKHAYPVDTHARANQFHDPSAQPDCTSFATSDIYVSAWPLAVVFWEFKLENTKKEHDSMTGQLGQRCSAALAAQPERQSILGVGMTMNTIEVGHISNHTKLKYASLQCDNCFLTKRLNQVYYCFWQVMIFSIDRDQPGQLHLSTTGACPFSVSPDSLGFQLLVRVLATPMDVLGFRQTALPNLQQLGDFRLERMQLIRCGGSGDSSYVFSVEAVSLTSESQPQAERLAAVLKLNATPLEVSVSDIWMIDKIS